MTCLDCTILGRTAPAVAVCRDCGGAICEKHAVIRHHHRAVVRLLNRVEPVEPAARAVRCLTCDAAFGSEHRNAEPVVRMGGRPADGVVS